jgi:hypothetical protein
MVLHLLLTRERLEICCSHLTTTSSNSIATPKKHIEELKRYVEIYFQCNILLFDVDFHGAFTPYKAKLLVLIRSLDSGNVYSLYDHLTEAAESSNHGTQLIYQQHSVRDGGYATRNVQSEFNDLFSSYMNAMKVSVNEQRFPRSEYERITERTLAQSDFLDAYLEIVTTPLTVPQLQLGKTTLPLRGMSFATIGRFGKDGNSDFYDKLITTLGGRLLTNLDTKCEGYGTLTHHYIVVKNVVTLLKYVRDGATSGIAAK